ncbi:hypothetical protein BDQ17DRAFT_1337289 [Cyathus striatus]|nr:hypothetical protein BDQ17DRAFT_1337289 [Cyathus striatus]
MSNSENLDAPCAVCADGTLKDASEIVWYNDKDDDIPLPDPVLSSVGGLCHSTRPSKPSQCIQDAADLSTRSTVSSRPVPSVASSAPSVTSSIENSSHLAPSVASPFVVNSSHSALTSKNKCPASGSLKSTQCAAKKTTANTSDGSEAETEEDDNDSGIPDRRSKLTYEKLKEMADADHEALNIRSKKDLTANITTIFCHEREHINLHTNKVQSGWWCKICLKMNPGDEKNFFTGSTSSLHMHIARLAIIGCMEHALHLAAKHFIETIAPTTSTSISKKVRAVLKKSSHRGELDLEELDHELAEINLDESEAAEVDSESDNEDFSFCAGNSLEKALALVKQIRKSPQACTFFKSMCVQVALEPLELLLWREAVDQFILLADDSNRVPDLPGNRLYSDFKLTKKDWERLNIMKKALHFSEVKSPTVWRVIPSLEFLIERWKSMVGHPNFHEVKGALDAGIKNLKKWYHRVDDTSTAYFICLVLDPKIKDVYFQVQWNDEQYQEGMKRLEGVFDEYYRPPESADSAMSSLAEVKQFQECMEVHFFFMLCNPISGLRRFHQTHEMNCINILVLVLKRMWMTI